MKTDPWTYLDVYYDDGGDLLYIMDNWVYFLQLGIV